jgi:hypothetical protein
MRVLGVIFDDLLEDATLSGGDRDKREDPALLLLERRPVSMKGNRSFIRADVGVSINGGDPHEPCLDANSGRCLDNRDIDSGVDRLRTWPCSLSVGILFDDTVLVITVCSCGLSRAEGSIGVGLC